MGGMVALLSKVIRSARSPRSSYEYQCSIEEKERLIVGVNAFVDPTTRRSKPFRSTKRSRDGNAPGSRHCAKIATTRRCERLWIGCATPLKVGQSDATDSGSRACLRNVG